MKRLIICADGTWNDAAQASPSNVVKMAKAIATSDEQGHHQVVNYHEGLGIDGGFWHRFTGGAFGAGISKDIQDIYLFLSNNFDSGDEIWLFGFSRGAYTVRSVAGLVRNCGILRRKHFERYAQAYELYRARDDASHPNAEQAVKFRQQYSTETRIRFIGVWDTVGALGIPVTPLRFWSKKRYEFHDVELSGRVDFAMQALAIDEKRKPFLAAVWQRAKPHEASSQVLEQAWFPGVHCDVGGGYAEAGLSDGALKWMIDGAQRAGLSFCSPLELAPIATGSAHASMTAGYALMGVGTRRLGTQNPGGNECLASFTEERRRLMKYAPDNLMEFLNRGEA